MFDFRLKVFYTVAKRLSFTRAADELFITQPAVTRHINELESYFKSSLIERRGNRKIALTSAGKLLLEHAEKLVEDYNLMQQEMDALLHHTSGLLRIGASTTIGRYLLPALLAKFKTRFPDVHIDLFTGNSEQIEVALINKDIDIGAIEGLNRNPLLHYEEFLKDEIVLVTGVKNTKLSRDSIKLDQIVKIPLVLREIGSGSLDVVIKTLKEKDVRASELLVEMRLDSTESIKTYLTESTCAAFLSMHSILTELRNNQLRIIDINGLSIERSFCLVVPHGHVSSLASSIANYLKNNLDR